MSFEKKASASAVSGLRVRRPQRSCSSLLNALGNPKTKGSPCGLPLIDLL